MNDILILLFHLKHFYLRHWLIFLKNIMKTSKSSFCTNLKIKSKVIRIISFIFIPSHSLKRIWAKKYLVKLSISFVDLSQSKFWIVLWRITKLLDNLLSFHFIDAYLILFLSWLNDTIKILQVLLFAQFFINFHFC